MAVADDVAFVAHQGSQSPAVLEGFLERAAADDPDWAIGATVFLPRYVPSTTQATLSSFAPHVNVALADPEAHRLEVPFEDRGRGRRDLQYLQESDPIANRKRFVRRVLLAQQQAGAEALISPWLTHGVSPLSTRNLRATLRFAQIATEYPLKDLELLFGFAVTEGVIADAEPRDDFIDAIVEEVPPGDMYLRIRVTPPTSYAQYSNQPVLVGLKHLVRALAANRRRTILPQVGLMGWLMLPFGAAAFGSGMNASMQRFVEPTEGFAAQPLEWYFQPQLLGFVLRDEIPALAQLQSFEPCECPYCPDLTFGGGPAWRRDLAGLHYLWWCATLANEAVADPATVGARIEGARVFWTEVQQASIALDPRSEPRHLAVWSAIAS